MTLDTRDQNTAQAALEASRQRVEDGLGALRQAIESSPVGRFGSTWTLPLLAAAVGFSLALLLRRRIRDGRADDDEVYDAYDEGSAY